MGYSCRIPSAVVGLKQLWLGTLSSVGYEQEGGGHLALGSLTYLFGISHNYHEGCLLSSLLYKKA